MAIQQSNDGEIRELALFAGAGGGILGGHLLGWRTVCAVERDAYAAQVLAQRQNDGILKPFPIWSNVTTFDGKPWRGRVDVVSGGFPCQPHSMSGKRLGMGDARWLWPEVKRVYSESGAWCLWLENVTGLISTGGLGAILLELSEMGMHAKWGIVSAACLGAEHIRPRIWILAYANGAQQQGRGIPSGIRQEHANIGHPRWGKDKSRVDRMANGVAFGVDRLKAIGNGQVPRVAATAWRILNDNY